MINLTAAQCKTAGFMKAHVTETDSEDFVIYFQKGDSDKYGVLDQAGKIKAYKSLATAAAFAKSCGVRTLTVEFQF